MDGQGTRETASERGLLAAPAPDLRLPLAPSPDLQASSVADTDATPGSSGIIALPGVYRRMAERLATRRPLPLLLRDLRRAYAAAFELEAARGAAFLLLPVLLCAGAMLYFALPFEPDLSALALAGVVFAAAALLGRTRPVVHRALAGLVLVAGMTAGKVEAWRADTKVVGGEISTRLTGRVETIEHRANGRVRLTLAVLATARPRLRYQPDRVRVTARAIPADTRPGSIVEGIVRLLPPLGPLRPDSYDFAFESYFDRIGASGFFLRDPQLVTSDADAPHLVALAARIESARTALAARIRGHIGGAEGEIAAALVAGVRAGIPEDANEALRITGLAHVLSISGLHMALVAGVVIGAMRAAFPSSRASPRVILSASMRRSPPLRC